MRALGVMAVLLTGALAVGGCRTLYGAPPMAGEGEGFGTKHVFAKREPDRLIAADLTEPNARADSGAIRVPA